MADTTADAISATPASRPFQELARMIRPQSTLRASITAAYRRPETECLPLLLSQASLAPPVMHAAQRLARQLIERLRPKSQGGGVEALLHEYSLSSQDGVALMCLAEALLRIPDHATRDALIRDKIGDGDWEAHLGHSPSLFVNAATWGLLITGRLTATSSGTGLSNALARLIAKGGEPLIRKGVDIAMRMLGEQFVSGRNINEALANSRLLEARGFRYSFDMLGEAAMTAADAARYYREYEQAIHAIGKAAARRGIYEGPGISIKLSALHPRYSRPCLERVLDELLPRLKALVLLARSYDIGINIDAEEADRLEISLDLLETLCLAPELAGWNGIGFVVQAYQKRATFVIDYLVDLGRRSGHRLMIRLVKGAYWDSEIKRAQADGLEGFPVFTRKMHTDVSYIACARKLLAVPDAAYPQFATHNALTLATIHAMAGGNYYQGQYEFQCLHGMGEPLYEEVVGPDRLNRPCRIYAPVGTHETLLAYLVRRLLENGANTSFVNQIANPEIPVEALVADPAAAATAIIPVGAAHPKIAMPRALFASRLNSAGLDISNEQQLASLSAALLAGMAVAHRAGPMLAAGTGPGEGKALRNPARLHDIVGHVREAEPADIETALAGAEFMAPIWASTPAASRCASLRRAADLLEERMPALIGLIVREAGKSIPNAIGEVREAVDFLRYYADGGAADDGDAGRALGPVACISPWNFPLAIFMGQVSAALATGNVVLAKPAEETPLIAAAAVRLLWEAGIPPGAVQLLPGDGRVGAALVRDARIRGVIFTGSTEVARLIQRELAGRLNPDGRPVPLIAETGGINAMIVDSSALPEQVVTDVIASAFDSAGQRCSALRLLCLQEDIADVVLGMLGGAMAELSVGPPDRFPTDVGPVISDTARRGILAHVEALRRAGCRITRTELPADCRHGHFVAPTLIELGGVAELEREIFGPVLHVVRFPRDQMDAVIDGINATGYALTFGIHSRIDETIAHVTDRIHAGNIYINRNIIGAVVGVQPFGGHGLSGTGPKAGGPLYLRRLRGNPGPLQLRPVSIPEAAREFQRWLAARGDVAEAEACGRAIAASPLGFTQELPGPVGERNLYSLQPRGLVRCMARSWRGACAQLAAVLATGNTATLAGHPDWLQRLRELPTAARAQIIPAESGVNPPAQAVLFEGDSDGLRGLAIALAAQSGSITPVFGLAPGDLSHAGYPVEWLVTERVITVNTAAAGGNASLMTIG